MYYSCAWCSLRRSRISLEQLRQAWLGLVSFVVNDSWSSHCQAKSRLDLLNINALEVMLFSCLGTFRTLISHLEAGPTNR